MKGRIVFTAIFWANITLSLQSLYAFENQKTHPAITERAAVASTIDDYLKTQIGMDDGINTQLSYDFPSEIQKRIERAQWSPEKTQRAVLEWLKVGSAIEDTDNTWYYKPIRPRHHFYDPTRNAGLDNKTDHPEWRSYAPAWGTFYVFDFTGESALTWAVDGIAPQDPTTNNQAWHNARTDLYNSLIRPLKNDREKYLAMTFLDLGCVLHMVEDMGVPAHTRNDFLFAHYREHEDYGEPLERWIEIMIPSNGSLERWIPGNWTPTARVFGKVSDYFDTDTRNASSYLGDGILPPDGWGLSESTNYQLLSWTTIFRGDTNSLYYFPHPAKIHTTEVDESGRFYLAGYGISHLAQKTMSYHYLAHNHLDRAWCTLGKFVYDDYAEISLPRTIDYAAGLLNYFFRGKLSIEQTDCNNGKIVITITNKSSNSDVNQVLKGGTFTLYWDNQSGNRTQVSDFTVYRPDTEPQPGNEWNSGTQMNYDESTKAVLTPPESADVNQYILVYEGIISSNPDSPDSDDTHQIATAVFSSGIPCNEACPSPPNCMSVTWTDSYGVQPSSATLTKEPDRCCWTGSFVSGYMAGQSIVLTYNQYCGWQGWYGTTSCDYFNEDIDGYTWSKSLGCSGGFVQLTDNTSGYWEKILFTLDCAECDFNAPPVTCDCFNVNNPPDCYILVISGGIFDGRHILTLSEHNASNGCYWRKIMNIGGTEYKLQIYLVTDVRNEANQLVHQFYIGGGLNRPPYTRYLSYNMFSSSEPAEDFCNRYVSGSAESLSWQPVWK